MALPLAQPQPYVPPSQQSSLPSLDPDRRRHKRFALTLLGRFMRANKQEYPCKMIDISVGGVSVHSPVDVDMSERIVAYFDHIGGVEGQVVRVFEGGFALQLNISAHKREKIAAQITWLINRDDLSGHEERRHERIQVNKTTQLKLTDDVILPVRLIDFSISGASMILPPDIRPVIGAEVTLGRLRARVVRHHEHGIAVQFIDVQSTENVRRSLG